MNLNFPLGKNGKGLAVINGQAVKFSKEGLRVLQNLCDREMEDADAVSTTGFSEDPSLDKDIAMFIDEHESRSRFK